MIAANRADRNWILLTGAFLVKVDRRNSLLLVDGQLLDVHHEVQVLLHVGGLEGLVSDRSRRLVEQCILSELMWVVPETHGILNNSLHVTCVNNGRPVLRLIT